MRHEAAIDAETTVSSLSRVREREGEGCSPLGRFSLDGEQPHPDPLPQAGEGALLSPVDKARRMRHQAATDAERKLWRALRSRQVQAKFRRQHPLGVYILDFVSLEERLVIEVDGGQHNEPRQAARDARRTAWLESQGFRVLRFWNNDVLTNLDGVLETIISSLSRKREREKETSND